MSFRICVYKDHDDESLFVAHCLDLDVMADGQCVRDAISELLKVIETQIEACQETGANLLRQAPGWVWQQYESAKTAGRKINEILVNQIIADANKRLGHRPPRLDNILASKEIPKEFLAVAS